MRPHLLHLSLLASLALSLATTLGPWFIARKGGSTKTQSLLETALGDGRRLFGNHFYAKADAYFHNGYYPTIFDNKEGYEKAHLAGDVHPPDEPEAEKEGDFLGQPRDWIEAFGRHFFPSAHSHLGEAECGHDCCQSAREHHGHDPDCAHKDHEAGHHEPGAADEREMLPWLKLSAELDPQRVETYVVTSYWLRNALKKVNEAEQFLRYGLQQNPGDYELLFELGRIYAEERKDPTRARNVWELALAKWEEREAGKPEPNLFLRAQILGQLARLEQSEKRYDRALEHLTLLLAISPNKDGVRKWLEEVQALR